MGNKRGQISFEYIIVMGFVTFVIVGILALAFVYSGGMEDSVKGNQVHNCANKIISAAESVYYQGFPSKATITCYLPDNINEVNISEDNLIFTFYSSSGTNKIAFPSKVPINGSLGKIEGLRKIKIEAYNGNATISLA